MITPKLHSIAALVAGMLFVSDCVSSAIGQEQGPAQASASKQVPADPAGCPAKWVVSGDSGAKAGSYFQLPCPPGQEQSLTPAGSPKQDPADPPECLSKWVGAGNNGAKADRYFKTSCLAQRHVHGTELP